MVISGLTGRYEGSQHTEQQPDNYSDENTGIREFT